MKSFLWVIFILTLLFFPQYSFGETTTNNEGFILPYSLIEINESAFEGTSPIIIMLSESVAQIGDEAFSNISTLHAIYIPDSVQYIGNNAIGGNVFMIGTEDSIGHKWAKNNHRHFTMFPSLKEYKQLNITGNTSIKKSKLTNQVVSKIADTYKKQFLGLTIGELKLIKIARNTDFRIDGRAPPLCLYCLMYI